MLIVDIETNGLNPDKIWYVCAYDPAKDLMFQFGKDDMDRCVDRLMMHDVLVMHNGIGFDIPVLEKLTAFSSQGKAIIDTLVMSRVLQQQYMKHDLASWAERLQGAEKVAVFDSQWEVYDEDLMRERCTNDVKITWDLYQKLQQIVEETGQEQAIELELAFAKELHQQEVNGVKFDVEFAKECLIDLEMILDELQECLDEYIVPLSSRVGKPVWSFLKVSYLRSGKGKWKLEEDEEDEWGKPMLHPPRSAYNKRVVVYWGDEVRNVIGPYTRVQWVKPDLTSHVQLKRWLSVYGWQPTEYTKPTKTNPRGSPKVTDDSLTSLKGELNIWVPYYMSALHRKSLIGGLLERVRPDGRIGAAGNSFGTATGRLAHKAVVNIPGKSWYARQCRSLFIPKDGYRFVGCDLSAAHLRVLADYMGDNDYIDAVLTKEKGKDVHTRNADVFGCSRDDAKTIIYTMLNGGTGRKIGSILGVSETQGNNLLNQFKRKVPAFGKLVTQLERVTKERGWLKMCNGLRIRNKDTRLAMSKLLQGNEAILLKATIVAVVKEIEKHYIDAKLVINMHDEVLFEVVEKDAKDLKWLIPVIIEDQRKKLGLTVPHGGEATIGNSWWEVH